MYIELKEVDPGPDLFSNTYLKGDHNVIDMDL